MRAKDSDVSNDVFKGLFALPGLSRREKGFVKIFPRAESHLLVLNEILSHRVAVTCGIPSPYTFPIAVPRCLVEKQSRVIDTYDPDGNECILGVGSLDGNPGQISQKVNAKHVIPQLMSWRYVAAAAAFDELIGNGDRHLGNLLRTGPSEFVLIDQERMVFERNWLASGLDGLQDQRCDSNILATTVSEGPDELLRRRMMNCAQSLMSETLFAPAEHDLAFAQVIGVEGRVLEFFDYLNERKRGLPFLMQWHLEKGDLFRTSTA